MYDIQKVKACATGRWKDLLINAFGMDEKTLKGKHTSCPGCGGKDRFRFDDKNGSGSHYCNACGPGDGLSLACKASGRSFSDTLVIVAGYLGVEPESREEASKRLERKVKDREQGSLASDHDLVVSATRYARLIIHRYDNCFYADGVTANDEKIMQQFSKRYPAILDAIDRMIASEDLEAMMVAHKSLPDLHDAACLLEEWPRTIVELDDIVLTIEAGHLVYEAFCAIMPSPNGLSHADILKIFKNKGANYLDINSALDTLLIRGLGVTITDGMYIYY